MAITTTVPDYTGNTPVIGQPQPEFNQNTADIFDYIGSVSTSINDVAGEMNSTATQVSNDASSASSSASSAAASADEAGAFSAGIINFAGDFVVGVTSAVSGSSYRYGGGYWTCVANTTSTPSLNNSNWRKVIGQDDIDEAEERAIGAGVSIYRGSNGSYVQDGDSVPVGTTHLAVMIGGKVEDVAMSPIASGVVSAPTETGAEVGGVEVSFTRHYEVPTVFELNQLPALEGFTVETAGYYTHGDGGSGVYDIVSGTADGYADILLDNGLVAKLRLSDTGFADFKQVGIKVFDSISDTGFASVDAGVILNALNNSRVLGLKSSTYGKVHLKTQYIDTKGMYFVAPRASKIDTASEQSFDIVCDKDTVFSNPAEGPFTIKSGVRKGGIVGLVISGGDGETFSKLFSFGDARYADDTANIISNYMTDGVIIRGGSDAIFCYQYFNCHFENTNPRNYRNNGWWNEEGGTSCTWKRCLPLSQSVGARGFVWNPNVETQGHVYSTMEACCPQLVSDEAYIFRNCSMTLTACSEEFSSYNSDSTMLFVGTGNYDINTYMAVHTNANKPQNIYGVKPTPSGRFGATLNIRATSIGITGFSGDKVGFMHYGAVPTSILSRAKWDISNTNQKSDPTSAIDYETWQSGYYYNTFVVLKQQLEEIETYTRSGQNTAIIAIDANTRHTITGEITTASGSAYVTFEVDTGSKSLVSASRVDAVATAGSDATNRGKIFHIDSGTDSTYATGNVYLRAFHKAGIDIFASFSSGALRIEFEGAGGIEGQTGVWTITRRRSANN